MTGKALRPGAVKTVTSLQNPIVKAVRALHQRKGRAESGLFLAEGHKLVLDAVSVGWAPEMILVTEEAGAREDVSHLAARVRTLGSDVIFTNGAVMEKLARRDNPQTVIGVFEQRLVPLSAMGGGTLVALEAPRDPGNVGTVVRTADALGAKGVILIGQCADPFGIEAVRATMGSLFHVPLARADEDAFIAFAKAREGATVGTHLAATLDVREATPSEPQILLMGTEQAGLTDALAGVCDSLVKIPMAGEADSLNLAVATALALYELRRPFLASASM
ncbi:MAG: RNA methyltransferase [Devosia sp.]